MDYFALPSEVLLVVILSLICLLRRPLHFYFETNAELPSQEVTLISGVSAKHKAVLFTL